LISWLIYSLRTITAQVPAELLDRAHERARLEDRSVASVVRRALISYLEAEPDRNGSAAPVTEKPRGVR
jgi:hypothetical protein